MRDIIVTPEFRSLQEIGAKLHDETSRFDLLALFDDVLLENAWSRIMTYLFNSEAEHRLGQRFLRSFLRSASPSNSKLSHFLHQLPKPESSHTLAVPEWQTPTNRRIDILIRILNSTGKTVSVVGIENKVDSGEQSNQIADYQEALIGCFPGISKVALYLTPDGREATTSAHLPECPCCTASYASILSACDWLLPKSQGQAAIFLEVLKTRISRMLGTNKMEKHIKSLIHDLYQNPNHRQAIKLLVQNTPNIISVFDRLQEFFEPPKPQKNALPMRNPDLSVEIYGTKEFKIQFDELDSISDSRGLWAVYMLHCPSANPDLGDRFTPRVMLWDNNLQGQSSVHKERLRRTIQSRMTLSESLGEHRHWGRYISLWVGNSYQLVDLGSKDVKALSNLLLDSVSQT